MRWRRRSALAVAAAAVVAAACADGAGRASAASCVPSRVYYRDSAAARAIGFRGHTPPWVGSAGVVGFLFYDGVEPFRRMHSARAYVTLDGEVGAGASTKVLWWFRRTAAVGSRLTISGTRLDREGSFRNQWSTRVVGPAFPSYLVVPDPGCWRVTVTSGAARTTFVFGAFRLK